MDQLLDNKLKNTKLRAKEIFYSFLLLNNTDKKRYRDLQTNLTNAYTQNRNNHPQSTIGAKKIINNYVPKFVAKENTKKKKKDTHQQGNNNK